MKTCTCCGARIVISECKYVGAIVYPFVYLHLVNCSCGSSQAVKLWESEEYALEGATV